MGPKGCAIGTIRGAIGVCTQGGSWLGRRGTAGRTWGEGGMMWDLVRRKSVI